MRSLYFSSAFVLSLYLLSFKLILLFLRSQNSFTASDVLASSLSFSQTSVLTKVNAVIATTSSVEVRPKLCLLVSVSLSNHLLAFKAVSLATAPLSAASAAEASAAVATTPVAVQAVEAAIKIARSASSSPVSSVASVLAAVAAANTASDAGKRTRQTTVYQLSWMI